MNLLWVSWVNAIFILAAIWVLAGGKLRLGNWLSLGACIAGFYINAILGLWPMVGMSVILFGRSSWILWTRRKEYG